MATATHQFSTISTRATLADQVFENLRAGLRDGRFEAGHVFSVPDLVSQFEVSRTPVRDALSRLVAEGVLHHDARGQVMVPAYNQDEYEELIEARAVVEGGAAALAAKAITKDEIETLKQIAVHHERTFDEGRIADMLEANAAFHFAIYRTARNKILLSTANSLWLRAGPYTRLLTKFMEKPIRARGMEFHSPHHQELISALEAGDAKKAQKAIISDIRTSRQLLLPFLGELIDNPKGKPS